MSTANIHLVILIVALILGSVIGYYRDPTTGATVTLAIVTVYYAWQTGEMVKEIRKDRYVDFLDKRLEKLYTPLLNLKPEIEQVLNKINYSEVIEASTIEKYKELNEKLSGLREYTHLASNELKEDLEKFLVDFSMFTERLTKIQLHFGLDNNRTIKIVQVPKNEIDLAKAEELEKKFSEIVKIAKEDAAKYRDVLIQLRDW